MTAGRWRAAPHFPARGTAALGCASARVRAPAQPGCCTGSGSCRLERGLGRPAHDFFGVQIQKQCAVDLRQVGDELALLPLLVGVGESIRFLVSARKLSPGFAPILRPDPQCRGIEDQVLRSVSRVQRGDAAGNCGQCHQPQDHTFRFHGHFLSGRRAWPADIIPLRWPARRRHNKGCRGSYRAEPWQSVDDTPDTGQTCPRQSA
jgi:hypothetical protein